MIIALFAKTEVDGITRLIVIAIIVITILISIMNKNKNKNIKSKEEIQYTNFYKENIIVPFLKKIKYDIEYKPNEGMLENTYKEGNFRTNYVRYTSDDLMNIVLKKKSLSMAEVLTEAKYSENGQVYYQPLFSGVVVKSELKKSINAEFFLRDSRDEAYWKLRLKAEKVIMDSTEFEKGFEVYSTNKIVAMQILTADKMQMLLEFKEETRNKNKI